MISSTLKIIVAAIAATALVSSCGGGSEDSHELVLDSGQRVTVVTDINVDLMPQAQIVNPDGCVPIYVAATFEVAPPPAPNSLVPVSASVLLGEQVLGVVAFDSAQTQMESAGRMRAVAVGCATSAINSDLARQLVGARIMLKVNGGMAAISSALSPLGILF